MAMTIFHPGRRRQRSIMSSSISRSEEHTSELQSLTNLVCRLLLEKKKRRGQVRRSSSSSVTWQAIPLGGTTFDKMHTNGFSADYSTTQPRACAPLRVNRSSPVRL